jgi:PAS domain S-box-containing protein
MKPPSPLDPLALRQAAEARLKTHPATHPPLTAADLPRLQHELELRQIELDIRHEELLALQANHELGIKNCERHQQSDELRQKSAFLEALVHSSPDGILVVDNQAKKVFQNQHITDLWKFPPGIASNPDDTVQYQFSCQQARDPAAFDQQTRRLASSPAACPRDEVELKDGTVLERQTSLVRSQDGQCYGRVWFFRDVTEQKRIEAAMHESEQRFSRMFHSNPVATTLTTKREGRYVNVNAEFLNLLERSREEVLGQTSFTLGLWVNPAQRAIMMAQLDQHGTVRDFDFEIRTKSGQIRQVLWSGSEVTISGESYLVGSMLDITYRKQVMDMLRESTMRLLEAQHIAGLGSYALDLAAGTWTGSEVLGEIFGLQDPGLPRPVADWLQVVHPLDRDAMQRYLAEEVLHSRAPFDRTYRIVRVQDRQERWVHGFGKLVLDQAGQVVKMIGTIQDITEHKRSDIVSHENEEKFSHMFNSSPIAIALTTLDEGRYLDVNDEFLNLLDRPRDEVIGHTALELEVWFEPKQRAAILGRLQAEGSVRNLELEIHSRSGRVRHVLWSAEKLVVGGQFCLLGSSLDITERKQSEDRMSLQLSALTAAANSIVITDPRGKIEWVNPSFTRLTGYPAAEAIGANPRFLKSGRHPPAFYATLWATISTGNVWHGELLNRRKDGRLYTEEMTITPVRGADGQIVHFVAIKQDVTEQRQLENQLRQAQKLQAIGTLAGGVAHDFNNILAIMLGACYLLQQDTAGNALAQENIRDLLQAAERARDLVRQILTFSRQHAQAREVIRLETIVKEVMKFLRASLPAQIKIETQFDPAAPPVLADPTQIYQVVLNLATNALHAMDGHPGLLTVSLDSFLPDADLIQGHPAFRPVQYARLTVTDTGHGMDAQTLEHMFEPFFTTKPVGQGTGLGLAVVHGIVQSHEGLITVQSQPGHGTTFRLHFPAKTQAPTPAPAVPLRPPDGQGQTILFVDDEPTLTSIVQQVMRRLNYQVITQNSAHAAMDLFRENPHRFHLVITDLTMPEMNGLDFARQIHALHPQIPILLASGQNSGLSAEELRATGIREVVKKPLAVPQLAVVLQRLLRPPETPASSDNPPV